MPTDRHARTRAVVPAAACAGLALILYLLTLAPTVYWSDSAELQRVAVTLEPPHPTGYPLYLLLGKIWTAVLPMRDAAWQMNLLSAVTAALAVGMVVWLTQRMSGRILPAVASGCVLAVAASFWSQAVVAEVYALHALLVTLILIAALRDRPSLPVLALLVGLGLAHHRMTLLLVPGLIVYLLLRRHDVRHDARQVALAALSFLVGIALYWLTYAGADWPSWRAFAAYVFHSAPQFWSTADVLGHMSGTLWPVASQQLAVAGLALAVLGASWCARRSRPCGVPSALLLSVSWLLGIAFFVVYRPPDLFSFAGHFQVMQAILIGLGMSAVLGWLDGRSRRGLRVGGTVLLIALIASGIALQAVGARQATRQSQEDWLYPRRRALQMLADAQSASIIVADPLLGQTARYLHEVEGVRPDVTLVIDPDKDIEAAKDLLDLDRPVYLWGTGWKARVDDPALVLVPAEHSAYDEGLFRLVRTGHLDGTSWVDLELGHREVPRLDIALEHAALRPFPLVADELAEIELCWSGGPSELGDRELRLALDSERGWLDHHFGPIAEADQPTDTCTRHRLVLPPAPFSDEVPLQLTLDGEPGEVEQWVIASAPWPIDPSSPGLEPGRMSAEAMAAGEHPASRLCRRAETQAQRSPCFRRARSSDSSTRRTRALV
jgi:hypothetical protein